MIHVRVELWPHGDRSKARLLQEMTITNVGGDVENGDYKVIASHATTFKGSGLEDPLNPPASAVWKRASIRMFSRKKSPLNLVMAALNALGV